MADVCPDCQRLKMNSVGDADSACLALWYVHSDLQHGPAIRICKELTIAKLRSELASARARVDQLPECFDLSNFVRAGLSLENATIALMASRRILEDAERAREKELKAE